MNLVQGCGMSLSGAMTRLPDIMGRSLAGIGEPAKRSAACGLTQVPYGGSKEFVLIGCVMGGG